jgi:hypothetical protein
MQTVSAAFVGEWPIVELDLWNEEDVDLVVRCLIELGADHTGSLGFIGARGGRAVEPLGDDP